jgi:AraC family transcriptional regulator
MTNLLSLGKGQYLGNITNIHHTEGIIVSAATADPSELNNDAPHCHENPIISFILEGDSIEKIDRHTGERSAGDLKFYRAGDLHQVRIKRFPSRNINFELEDYFLTQYELSEDTLALTIGKNLNAKPVFLRMYNELLADDVFTGTSLQMLLLGLASDTEQSSKQKRPRWITALYKLLDDRWNEQITLQELSQAIDVHPVTISKYFTRYSSCTLGEYVRKLRIDRSLSLIKNSKLSLTEIASQCGFADQSHFTRNFKKLTGLLPKHFKKL